MPRRNPSRALPEASRRYRFPQCRRAAQARPLQPSCRWSRARSCAVVLGLSRNLDCKGKVRLAELSSEAEAVAEDLAPARRGRAVDEPIETSPPLVPAIASASPRSSDIPGERSESANPFASSLATSPPVRCRDRPTTSTARLCVERVLSQPRSPPRRFANRAAPPQRC